MLSIKIHFIVSDASLSGLPLFIVLTSRGNTSYDIDALISMKRHMHACNASSAMRIAVIPVMERHRKLVDMRNDPIPIQIFISCSQSPEETHAHSDFHAAFRLKESLEKQGFLVFIYLDNFAPGTDLWKQSMKDIIHRVQAVICLVSPNTPETDYVTRELEFVATYNRSVYPIWIAGNDWEQIVPRALRGQRYFDLRHGQYSATALAELRAVLIAQHEDEALRIYEKAHMPHAEPVKSNAHTPLRSSLRTLRRYFQHVLFKPQPERSAVNRMAIGMSSQVSTTAPYKGLEPFTQQDARYFFGREQLIEKIINCIIDLTEQQSQPNAEAPLRFISIVGASGSGKSSLVMAGVMAYLRQRDQHWICLPATRPGYDPLGKLAQMLAPYQPPRDVKAEDTLAKNLRDNATGLQKLTEAIARYRRCHLILYIDQFEELFTTGINQADQELFIDRLESVARDPNKRVFVLITLRADFYHRLLENNRLAVLLEQQTITVPAMNVEQLRDVIEKPARLAGLTFEGNLVGDLLNDISKQREALPLLQFTLKKLYDQSDQRLLTTRIYEEMGGVSGALDRYAEDIYQGKLPAQQSLTSDRQREMAHHLFSKLIYINGSVDNATRKRAWLSEFELSNPEDRQIMQETIEVFVNARLLIQDNQGFKSPVSSSEGALPPGHALSSRTGDDNTTLEISHEALIREWKSLRTWIELHLDDLHVQQSVDDASKQWGKEAEPKEQLYSGKELKKALTWAVSNKPNAAQMRFLQKSQRQQRVKTTLFIMICISSFIVAFPIVLLSFNYAINYAVGKSSVVNNTNDDGPGSLRQVLSTTPAGGEIHFAPSVQGRITLSSDDLTFNRNVTIDGPSEKILEISEQGQHRIIIASNKTVTLQNLVFAGSHIDASSFITNQGDLTLNTCFIHGNSTVSNGGGISNEGGTLTLQNTIISQNTASGNGGGVYTQSGVVNINRSTIDNNTAITSGGGIYSLQGSVFVNHSSIEKNQAQGGSGGGIDAFHGLLIFTASTVKNNLSTAYGGGIAIVGSQATISTALISQNKATNGGGGLAVIKDTENSIPSQLTVMNTDLAHNLKAPYAVRQNTVIQPLKTAQAGTPDILGIVTTHEQTTHIVSDERNYKQGSPASNFMPETDLGSYYYLGTADLDTFCQFYSYSYGSLSEDHFQTADDIEIKCFAQVVDGVDSGPFTALEVCQHDFPNDQNVIDRLADHNDQSALQCYRHVRVLGPIATVEYMQHYCQSLGDTLDNNNRVTAYDWKCLPPKGPPTGLSITNMCQFIYKNQHAFDQLVYYYRPDGWNCLAPA